MIEPNKGKIISENTVWDHLISLLFLFPIAILYSIIFHFIFYFFSLTSIWHLQMCRI